MSGRGDNPPGDIDVDRREPFVATVPESLSGMRVDRAVAMLTGVPRSTAAELIALGKVSVDGRAVATRSRPLEAGAVVTVVLPAPESLRPDPAVAVTVVHEDDQVLVVDKQAGVVVHPGAGTKEGTLVAGILARYPEIASVGDPRRPGIVHRLDRGTSGLLVVARTPAAYDSLTGQLAARTVTRRYLTLVAGNLAHDRGAVEAPIGRSDRAPTMMAVSASGRPARTSYEVVERFDELPGQRQLPEAATLLRCSLETGRTHQIRVHFAAIGHPVVGDDRYGRGSRGLLPAGRLFLHAAELSLDHPSGGRRLTWSSALPDDLARVLAR